MKDIFKNIYYRYKLGTSCFNNIIDTNLDTILCQCINCGIKSILIIDDYDRIVTFNNGIEYIFWNSNRNYAWLNAGVFKKINKEIYRYSHCRPTVKTMWMFDVAINEYYLLLTATI